MAAFMMMGKYSAEALKGISADRTKKAIEIIEGAGGKVTAMYALLGEQDLAFVVELPGIEDAMKTSIALNKLTGISFSTVPAVPVDDFDKLMG